MNQTRGATTMRTVRLRHLAAGALLLIAAASVAVAAQAPRAAPGDLPAYAAECGACHVAYAPRLLPAASWARLMGGLDQHYGSDASLDPALRDDIARWLAAHASTRKSPPPEDRITRSTWFRHEHDEIRDEVWARPAVGGPGQCNACHRQADQGGFRERDIRIPR
jgi:hypothetical protein